MQTDIDIDPAGDVWAMNNWQDVDSCYANPSEALSTRCGGQGVVVFYGMAKPVRTPQIGPARGLSPGASSLEGARVRRATPDQAPAAGGGASRPTIASCVGA
jgi:hypothetical protein